jgi:hypothetical protein
LRPARWQAGSVVEADGTISPQFTAVLPFAPSVGTVCELSATFDTTGDWAAIGFLTEPGNLKTGNHVPRTVEVKPSIRYYERRSMQERSS